jgi:TolB-like protein
VIITDLCECQLKRERGTEPLKGIIDKLNKEKKVPSHIITSMHGLNDLSTYGTHPKDFDPEQIKPVLNNLDIIIKWYLKYKETGLDIKAKPDEEISHEIKSNEDVKKSITISRKKLAGLIGGLFGAIVAVFAVLYFSSIIGGDKQTKELDKSIAVLPFEVWNSEAENQYLGGAIANEINTQLSLIEKFHVISYTSSSHYKGSEKPSMPRIGKELGANFIIEGTIERQADDVSIHVQVIRAEKDDHFWAQEFKGKWGDLYTIRADIAKKVAEELNTSLTDEEKQLIDRIPTWNTTASDYYRRGREEHISYRYDNNNREALERAEGYYRKALEFDPEYAQAYAGLAGIYWDKNVRREYFSKNYLDSARILAELALTYDNDEAEANVILGDYYGEKGDRESALEEYNKALKVNPNSWEAYRGKAYLNLSDDLVVFLENAQKAASLVHGQERQLILGDLFTGLVNAGFTDFVRERLKFNIDTLSLIYYFALGRIEEVTGNYIKSVDYFKMASSMDSSRTGFLLTSDILSAMGGVNMFAGYFEESLKIYKRYIALLEARDEIDFNNMHRIGYAYERNGYGKEAEYYFDLQMERCNDLIKSDRPHAQKYYTYYDRAGIYAFRGEKEKAYKDLRIFNQRQQQGLWMVTLIKHDPLFDRIRNEPEFQQIIRDVEAKYQVEHERVRKWLKEQGML